MNERIDRTQDYMNFIMTPPIQDEVKYGMYVPQVSTMRLLDSRNTGLGEVVAVGGGSSGSENQSWVMPVVIIVVSAMALMTLYAVLNKR